MRRAQSTWFSEVASGEDNIEKIKGQGGLAPVGVGANHLGEVCKHICNARITCGGQGARGQGLVYLWQRSEGEVRVPMRVG